jgi:hypothetical protein
MRIKIEHPPNYLEIIKHFDVENNKSVVFTYGDTLYNPNNGIIQSHLIAHEGTHSKQQGDNPAKWWDKYFVDKEFRLAQELEAYQNQYRFFCESYRDKNQRFQFLHKIAKDLSGEIYGRIIPYSEAIKQIKNTPK